MKICTKCNRSKEESEFHTDNSKSDGKRPDCKECVRAKCISYSHSSQGKEVRSLYNKAWSKENAHKKNASCRARQAKIIRATPNWADLDRILELYKQAKILEKETGILYEVDHIVPLKSKMVCGLHVEDNLRVIPATENRIKGNRAWPDCP